MKTLLMIDIQNDFVPGGALAVANGDKIIPIVNALQAKFSHIVATQDWHPRAHKSFAANHVGEDVGNVIMLNGLMQILWPVHCVQYNVGADFVAELDMSRVARVFTKGTDIEIDSYSGFFDNGRRKATGLGDYLQAAGTTEVYIVGLATDYCVKYSALDSISLGFKTYLIEDACKGVNLQVNDVANAIAEMQAAGVVVIQSSEV